MDTSQPLCPRCGYDQSGIIATWLESCPLEGVCSECGLDIRWEELLSSKFAPPEWSFEHGHRARIGRLVRTIHRVLSPPRFWRDLKLTHPVVVRRLAVLAIVWLLGCHLAIAAASGVYAYSRAVNTPAAVWIRFPPGPGAGVVPRGLGPLTTTIPTGPSPREEGLAAALWPYRPDLAWWSLTPGDSAIIAHRGFELLVFMATIPPGFLVLGETFRRCKVRFVHLARGAAYSATLPALGCVLCAISVMAVGRAPWGLIFLAGVAWLGVFWVMFVRRYLRLTHSAWVAAAMLAIAGLCTVIVMAVAYTTRVGMMW